MILNTYPIWTIYVQSFVKSFAWCFIIPILSHIHILIVSLHNGWIFSKKKKISKARKDISAGYNLLGITIDSIYRTVAFDNSPESKKNQIYKVNEIGRYALYDRRTVFLVSRGSSLKDAANIANIIPFFRVINELRFFLLRWESKHANNRSEVRDKRVLWA